MILFLSFENECCSLQIKEKVKTLSVKALLKSLRIVGSTLRKKRERFELMQQMEWLVPFLCDGPGV